MSVQTHIETNLDRFIENLERMIPSEAPLAGMVINATEYAVHLHNRMAYWVMNDAVLERNWQDEHEKVLNEASAAGEIVTDDQLHKAAFRALERTVLYYQEVIGFKDTRGKVKLPPRPMHPGAWADDTETLVKAYVSVLVQAGITIDHSTYDDYSPVAAAA